MVLITDQQAYRATLCFIRYYYGLTQSTDVFLMLEAMELVGEGETNDPGMWSDWMRCVDAVVAEGPCA